MSQQMAGARLRFRALALAPVLAAVGLWCVHVTAQPFGGAYLYFPLTAVWASSLYGGLGPGIASLALSLLGFDYLFLGKPGHFGVAHAQEAHRLLEFALAGIAGSFICARYRTARLAAQRAELEIRCVGALQE
jgi:K+-sensing histidine kinase KdpD